jgi:hypothetical protein
MGVFMADMTFKYGAPMPAAEHSKEAWEDEAAAVSDICANARGHVTTLQVHQAYQRGVGEGIVEGRKQIYIWVLDGLKTLMPLLKLEFASKTLLQGFMYQLEKFSKTGRHPTNEDE